MEQNNKPKSFTELVPGDKLYRIRIDWADTKKYRNLNYAISEYIVTENPYHNEYDIDLCVPHIDGNGKNDRVYIPHKYQDNCAASVGEYIQYITDLNELDEFLLEHFNKEIEKASAIMTEHLKIYEEQGDKIDLLQHLMIKMQRNK